MKKYVETTVNVLVGIGLLWAAVVIFVWGGGKLQQARDSRDWPQIDGRVITSDVDDSRRREIRPHVVYAYTVAGTPYNSSQISFDLFDQPGGEGRLESIMARYPVGQKVTVYYDPNEPATAILEPEVYAPFFRPLFFGALFLFGGALLLLKTCRQVMDGPPVGQQGTRTKHRILATATISVVIYSVIVLVSFNSDVRETSVKAFGERPAGIPNILFVLALQTLLYLPMPWVFWHAMRLSFQAMQDGRRRIGIGFLLYLLTVGMFHPHLRRSQIVCIGGLVYFLVICGAWIVYAATCGI